MVCSCAVLATNMVWYTILVALYSQLIWFAVAQYSQLIWFGRPGFSVLRLAFGVEDLRFRVQGLHIRGWASET